MKRQFIFGANALSELVAYYLKLDKRPVEGLVLHDKYVCSTSYNGLNLFSIEEMIGKWGKDNISVYVTTAYINMNRSREFIFNWLKENGIEILSYIHPSAVVAENSIMKSGNIVLENCSIQPFTQLGDGNIVWNNATICHHSILGSYNYISPAATITGRVKIGNRNFFGANSTIKNDTEIGDEVLIGAGAYVPHDLHDSVVFLPTKGQQLIDKESTDIHIK